MRVWGIFFGLVLMTISSVPAAIAQERFAMVLGNNGYETIGRLQNAENDANLIADTLETLGFETERRLDFDAGQISEILDLLEEKSRQADVLAVYFAGHGVQIGGENYILPVDARIRSEAAVKREGLALSQIMAILENAEIGLVFLDACRNNPLAEALAKKLEAKGRGAQSARGLAPIRAAGDTLVAFATLPNTIALDGENSRNSPFAEALAKHLPTSGVEVSVIMKRITADVVAKTNGEQRPQQLSQMQREFYFAPSEQVSSVASQTQPAKAPDPILSVYPRVLQRGDEVALFADVPMRCDPSFFNVNADGKVQPIPRKFFAEHPLPNSQIRYEISAAQRFGLQVTPQDPIGRAALGFICENSNPSRDDRLAILKSQRERLQDAGRGLSIEPIPEAKHVSLFLDYEIR